MPAARYFAEPYASTRDWESRLDLSRPGDDGNFNFKLTLKIFFRPVEARNGPQQGYYAEEDSRYNAEYHDRTPWNQWRREFKIYLEEFWDRKFWLVPPDDYDELNYLNVRPNLRCRIEVALTETQGGAHHVFNALRQAEYRVNRVLSGGPGFTGWLADVDRGSELESTTKLTDVGRAGHLIFMPQAKRARFGLNRYYGLQVPLMYSQPVAVQDEANKLAADQRGVQSLLLPVYAHPWQLAAQIHTGVPAEKWKIATRVVKPQPVKKKDDDSEKK